MGVKGDSSKANRCYPFPNGPFPCMYLLQQLFSAYIPCNKHHQHWLTNFSECRICISLSESRDACARAIATCCPKIHLSVTHIGCIHSRPDRRSEAATRNGIIKIAATHKHYSNNKPQRQMHRNTDRSAVAAALKIFKEEVSHMHNDRASDPRHLALKLHIVAIDDANNKTSSQPNRRLLRRGVQAVIKLITIFLER